MHRILVVDDHTVMAEGIKMLMEKGGDFRVVDMAQTAEDGVRLALRLNPDAIIMDLHFAHSRMTGFEAIHMIRRQHPSLPILTLSWENTAGFVMKALEAGAAGYIVKEDSSEELVSAVRKVIAGERFISHRLRDKVMEALLDRTTSENTRSGNGFLNKREIALLIHLARGKCPKEIADELKRNHKTIETHRRNLFRKIGVDNLASLVKYAIQNKYIKPEDIQ
ncbi:MAG TPA: response regulator transcription factor [Calditrichia bacterium]|nr:response regulator transcription factor [Calditrichota bacterium]HQU73020.1 response regulator transcription factor [Calditrichia bacterium]HQV33050.1 response regulator transcription factor [Calditrichia bacterium]